MMMSVGWFTTLVQTEISLLDTYGPQMMNLNDLHDPLTGAPVALVQAITLALPVSRTQPEVLTWYSIIILQICMIATTDLIYNHKIHHKIKSIFLTGHFKGSWGPSGGHRGPKQPLSMLSVNFSTMSNCWTVQMWMYFHYSQSNRKFKYLETWIPSDFSITC